LFIATVLVLLECSRYSFAANSFNFTNADTAPRQELPGLGPRRKKWGESRLEREEERCRASRAFDRKHQAEADH
jgi:hypothetical protein